MSAWRAFGNLVPLVPAGIINQYGGSTAPSGYLMCTGQSISTTEYPALFQAIGYTYGGSGASFNVPNLQNHVPVGLGAEIEFNALGKTGGNKIHQLSVNEMPIHSHEQNPHNHDQNSHTHNANSNRTAPSVFSSSPSSQTTGFADGGEGIVINTFWANAGTQGLRNVSTTTATNKVTTATNQDAGGGQAHNNLQPYIVLNYIIKT
jgi:microcystin-dependent protein